MQIVNKSIVEPIDFDELNIGDVFREADGSVIYLRLDSFETDSHDYFDAVNLYTMEYITFSNSDRVIRLNAELVIS